MINFLKILLVSAAGVVVFACAEPAHTAALSEKTVKVWGNCDQCKATIEGAAKIDGVAQASWNEDTKLLTLKMDTAKTTVAAVLKSVAESGYDNEMYPAPDLAFSGLPECCQYERKPAQ